VDQCIEPDGRHGTCSNCGHPTLFGLEEAVLEGFIPTFSEKPV
jgi:hypothetical protein